MNTDAETRRYACDGLRLPTEGEDSAGGGFSIFIREKADSPHSRDSISSIFGATKYSVKQITDNSPLTIVAQIAIIRAQRQGAMSKATKTNSALGKALKEYREISGLSQERLSERADLDRSFVSLLERGLRSPSFDTLLALSHGLDLPAATLVARATEILTTMDS